MMNISNIDEKSNSVLCKECKVEKAPNLSDKLTLFVIILPLLLQLRAAIL